MWPEARRSPGLPSRVPEIQHLPHLPSVTAGQSARAVSRSASVLGVRSCSYCSSSISPLRRADVKYCSPKCRNAAHREGLAGVIPAELLSRDRWIRHTSSKRPLSITGGAASSTDPSTWSNFAEAHSSSAGAGLGFVLNGDGLVCLDLDHVLDGDLLAEWAASLLAELPPTYVEVSPSGDGLHVWGLGHLERGRRVSFRGGTVEAYSSGRYLTITGRPYSGSVRSLSSLDSVLSLLV